MTMPLPMDPVHDDRHPTEGAPTRARPLTAVGIGALALVLVIGILIPLGDGSSRIIHAVLLIIPVIVAGLLGGRVPAVAVSALAAVAFSMFLEPIGSPQVHLRDDAIALAVFVVVAAATGVLVATVVNTERRRVAAEHDRLEALERTEQQRKALLRSVSHDLRTPLASIRGATEELVDGVGYDEAGRRELLGMVLAETERLDRIVANLLSLSRIEAGALLPDRRPLDLEELVRSSAERLASALTARTVDISVLGDLPPVAVDRSQIDQVVTNVLENAARHSPPETAIAIALRRSGDQVEIVVTDDGDGFPAGSEDKIFEPFAMATGSGSSGIGLAICRSIVEAHGGTVTATNRPGGGARVTIRLPIG
jgi:K+-sensing histidine kinase KdpD